jgi:hypothetical protein
MVFICALCSPCYLRYQLVHEMFCCAITISAIYDLTAAVSGAVALHLAIRCPSSLSDAFLAGAFPRNAAAPAHNSLISMQPLGGSWTLWNFASDSCAHMLLSIMFALGLFILIFATFCIDHFSLFGLSQAFNADLSAALGISSNSNSANPHHQ